MKLPSLVLTFCLGVLASGGSSVPARADAPDPSIGRAWLPARGSEIPDWSRRWADARCPAPWQTNGGGVLDEQIEALRARIFGEGPGALALAPQEDGSLTGRSIHRGQGKPAGTIGWMPTVALLRDLGLNVQAANPEQRETLQDWAVLVIRHFVNQCGDGTDGRMGVIDGNGYAFRSCAAVPALRWAHHLQNVDPDLRARFCGMIASTALWTLHSQHCGASTDVLLNRLPTCASAVSAMPPGPVRDQWLAILFRWVDGSITGPNSPFQPDGSVHHHGGIHHAYDTSAITPILQLYRRWRDGGFVLGPEARERLRQMGRTSAWLNVGGQFPMTTAMRVGTAGRMQLMTRLEPLVRICAEPGQAQDPEMAMLLDRQRHRRQGHLQGTYALATGPHLIWRQNDHQLIMRGSISRWRGHEIYTSNHPQSMQVVRGWGGISAISSGGAPQGFAPHHGFNWCRFPFGTARELPEARCTHHWRGALTEVNDSGYACVAADGKRAAWGLLYFRRNGLNEGRFHASAMVLNERLHFTTTAIAGAGQDPFHTTLFQQHLGDDPAARPVVLDGQSLTTLDVDQTLAIDAPHRLIDACGHRWLVHPLGNSRLKVSRLEQTWVLPMHRYVRPGTKPIQRNRIHGPMSEALEDFEPRRGAFATAMIMHGPKPQDAACAFTMELQGAPAVEGDPSIHQADEHAHVVQDQMDWGYVTFSNLRKDLPGPVVEIGRRCALTLAPTQTGHLQLAIASSENGDGVFTFRLRDRWDIHEAPDGSRSETVDGTDTLLHVPSDPTGVGLTRLVILSPHEPVE